MGVMIFRGAKPGILPRFAHKRPRPGRATLVAARGFARAALAHPCANGAEA
jgi:hypothetical protein